MTEALAEALREIEAKACGLDHTFESSFHAWVHEKSSAAVAAYEAAKGVGGAEYTRGWNDSVDNHD